MRGSGARQSRKPVRSETGHAVEADVVSRHIARTRNALRRFTTHTLTTAPPRRARREFPARRRESTARSDP